MSLAERAPQRPAVQPCIVTQTLAQLPEEESNALAAMLVDTSGWPNQAIAAACREEGISLGKDSIRRHRLDHCRCNLPR